MIIFIAFPLKLITGEIVIKSDYRYGAFAHYQLNSHVADFRELPGVPNCCPRFTSGTGGGFSFGFLYEKKLDDLFFLGLRAYYSKDGALLSRDESVWVNRDDLPFEGTLQHDLQSYINTVGFEPLIGIRLFDHLLIMSGFRAGIILVSDYSQKEILKDPSTGTFENGARVRNNSSGKIGNASFNYLFFQAGAAYELPLNENKTYILSPEIFYAAGINNLVDGYSWRINHFRAGLAVKYSPPDRIIQVEKIKELHIDTLKLYLADMKDTIYRKGRSDTVTRVEETEDLKLTREIITRTDTLIFPEFISMKTTFNGENGLKFGIKRYYVTEQFPIIPYIFFDENTDVIPQRFRRINMEDYQDPEYDLNPVKIQRNMLSIIGERMRENPGVTLQLTGTADNNNERGNCSLAERRAEAVKEFLINNWSIDSSRITVNNRKPKKCYPENPTLSRNDDGYADNRRVEFKSSDNSIIFAPVTRKRFLDQTDMADGYKGITVKHHFSSSGITGSQERELTGRQDGNEIMKMKVGDTNNDLSYQIDTAKIKKLDGSLPLIYDINSFVNGKKYIGNEEKVKVDIDTTNIEVERYSLTFFIVSWDSLSAKEKNEFVSLMEGINENKNVTVTGYTDYLGDKNNNLRLSAGRAEQVAGYILETIPKAVIKESRGVADEEFPPGISSYNTPEERFLSRTVKIEFKVSK